MLSCEKKYYLQAMGIVNWRLRYSPQTRIESTFAIYQLIFIKDDQQWLLLADASVEENQQKKEIRLLSAIMQALDLANQVPDYSLYFSQSSFISLRQEAAKFCYLLMGPKMVHLYHECDDHDGLQSLEKTVPEDILIDVSLSQLLDQPLLKAKIWQQLLEPVFTITGLNPVNGY